MPLNLVSKSLSTLHPFNLPSSKAILNSLFLPLYTIQSPILLFSLRDSPQIQATQKAFIKDSQAKSLQGSALRAPRTRQGTHMQGPKVRHQQPERQVLTLDSCCFYPFWNAFLCCHFNFSKDTENRDVYKESLKFILVGSFFVQKL